MDAPSGYQDQPPRKKQTHTWLWILLGVFVVCGCGGFAAIGAILVPVFLQARNAAVKTLCLSNTRQIATGQLMYATDWDDHLPASQSWIDLTSRYERGTAMFSCPTVSRRGGRYGYAENEKVGGKPVSAISAPRTATLVYETGKLAKNAAGDPATDPPPNRHGSGRSQSYVDGHAEFIKPDSYSGSN